jgi:hypothetical protein
VAGIITVAQALQAMVPHHPQHLLRLQRRDHSDRRQLLREIGRALAAGHRPAQID